MRIDTITIRSAASMFKAVCAVAFALLLGGCSTSNTQSTQLSPKGEHPAGWLQTHYAEFIKNPDQCRTCHGSTTDPKAAGGIANVSCFSCHPHGPSHAPGWEAPGQHGRLGAQAAPGVTAGFAYCAKCHGSTYNNGPAVSCMTCHTKSPHPSRPWVGTSASAPSHTMTDAANAPECVKCHADGANSTLKPTTPAPPGTIPGCFNNTMCHGRSF